MLPLGQSGQDLYSAVELTSLSPCSDCQRVRPRVRACVPRRACGRPLCWPTLRAPTLRPRLLCVHGCTSAGPASRVLAVPRRAPTRRVCARATRRRCAPWRARCHTWRAMPEHARTLRASRAIAPHCTQRVLRV